MHKLVVRENAWSSKGNTSSLSVADAQRETEERERVREREREAREKRVNQSLFERGKRSS